MLPKHSEVPPDLTVRGLGELHDSVQKEYSAPPPSAGLGGWGFARKIRVPELCSYREDNVMLDTQRLGYMETNGSSA